MILTYTVQCCTNTVNYGELSCLISVQSPEIITTLGGYTAQCVVPTAVHSVHLQCTKSSAQCTDTLHFYYSVYSITEYLVCCSPTVLSQYSAVQFCTFAQTSPGHCTCEFQRLLRTIANTFFHNFQTKWYTITFFLSSTKNGEGKVFP